MNERIRELADEAMKSVCIIRMDNGQIERTWNPRDFEDLFAQMIIRECAEIALREDHEPSECILSHFGLKR